MRYKKDHKTTVAATLLAHCGRLVKEQGMKEASVDKVMATAGLTGAALYAHFPSKEALLVRAVEQELSHSLAWVEGPGGDLTPERWARLVSAHYLTLRHARNPGDGCALAALTADVSRAAPRVREAYAVGLARLQGAVAAAVDDEALAPALLALVAGAIAMARAVPDDHEAQRILDSAALLIERLLWRQGQAVATPEQSCGSRPSGTERSP